MDKSFFIHVKEPCQENWDSMTATYRGAFCAACRREVIDFTHLTDYQLYQALQSSTDVCGRFSPHHLHRPLTITEPSPSYRLMTKAAAALISFFAFYRAYAEGPDQTYRPPVDTIAVAGSAQRGDTPMPIRTEVLISGMIRDFDTQSELSDVTVRLLGTGISARTDSTGFFCIDTSLVEVDSLQSYRLLIKCEGYQSKYVTVKHVSDCMHITLKPNYTFKMPPSDLPVMGLFSPQPTDYPGFQETADFIFYRGDSNDERLLSVGVNHHTPTRHPKPSQPLRERISAWLGRRRSWLYDTLNV